MTDSRKPPAIKTVATRLVLIDDHALVRAGLCELLKLEGDFDVLAEAGNGEVGARVTSELRPDVVIMDLSMPVLSGVEATKRIVDADPAARVLVLSAHQDASYASCVLEAGALGYVLKRSPWDEVLRAIRAVAAGDRYVDPVIAESLPPRGRRTGSGSFAVVSLSDREREVIRLVAMGHTAKEMADQLGLSPRTLETYKARAMAKLDINSRAGLIRYAARCGWLREG